MEQEVNNNGKKVDIFFEMFEEALRQENQRLKLIYEKQLEGIKEELIRANANIPQVVAPVVNTVVDKKVEEFKVEFDGQSGKMVTTAIKKQIKESQPDIIDALYPIMGKLITKFLQIELEKLSEGINKQIENTFSVESMKRQVFSIFGIKQDAQILKNANKPNVEEAYVIEQDSGMLLAEYTNNDSVDNDMVAGMITAIKSFVKDAFYQDGELDMIEYGTFKIILYNARKYYLVAALKGVVDSTYKYRVLDYLKVFDEKYLSKIENQGIQLDNKAASDALTAHFDKFEDYNINNTLNTLHNKLNKIDEAIKQKSHFNWKFWRW